LFGQIRHYVDAVLWAGGVPLLIPTLDPLPQFHDYLERIDGILLPGSPTDIDPARYGETPHPKLGKAYQERDALDFALLEHADRTGIPVLGICFGAQSLNVHRGGTLVQDIPSAIVVPLKHDSETANPLEATRHPVGLDRASLMARLAGSDAAEVNSYHHQSILEAGRNLRITATAPDGVVEAVEDTTGRFVIGVQWHPERGWLENPLSRAIFTTFVQEAAKPKSALHPV
jgi:putative glutamine amidotransferase